LSSFELVEQAEQPRALPKYTACQGIGYKRTSRNCPIRIRATIVEESQYLQEIELSQTLTMPTTPCPAKRVRIEIPDSASIHASAQTLFTLGYRLQTAVNSTTYSNNIELVFNTVFNIQDSPSRIFVVPEGILVLAEGISETGDLLISPVWSLPCLLLLPRPPYTVVLLLLKPLYPEYIEIAIIWYKKTKQSWLVQNLHIQPKDYRKACSFKKVSNIKQYFHYLPREQQQPNREIIKYNTI
jgi:hypothetical protein